MEGTIMTIEIADRLIKLRKEKGYSQEELADKLGLSRQAVSKWERAEASPDTDNLICLAKLYGISLDELLSTDEDIETIVKEQVKREDEPKEKVHIEDDEGNVVIVNNDGVICKDKNGHVVKKGRPKLDKFLRITNIVEGGLGILAFIVFILLGTLAHVWFWAWVVFFVPEIACSLVRAIHKKNAAEFNMPFLAVFVFFFVCMAFPGLDANLWHPMWLVFFTIPLFYITVSMIKNIMKKEETEEKENE